MAGIQEDVSKILRKQHSQEHDTIINWLTPINYASQQSDYIGRRQAGTGQWLLDSVEYQEWLKKEKQTLFCPGIPGAGKSILTSIVIQDLYLKFQDDLSIGIAFLYCDFQRQVEQKAEDLLAGLLKQLSQEQSPLPDSVKAFYEKHKYKHTRPLFDEISRTLESVAAMYSRVFIVIDALDECQVSDGCRTRFLSEMLSFQAKCGINLFATSRFIPDIIENLKSSISLEIRAREEDIRRYLDSQIANLPLFVSRSPNLQEEIKAKIVRAVDGMFLLAYLHLNSLRGKWSPKAIRTALEKLPSGSSAYDETYTTAMERIEGQVDSKELTKRVLSWIICAKRPLAATELQHALAVEAGEPELDKNNLTQVEDMVSVCEGLVTVDEESNIIRLVHYTMQEYFERSRKRWFINTDEDITIACVTYLSFSTFEGALCRTDKEFGERLQLNQFYDYAARYWGYHARNLFKTLSTLVLMFLESEAKVEASSQVIMASRLYSIHSPYRWDSQRIPRQIKGIHLAAYFGLSEEINCLLSYGHSPNLKDTYNRTPLWYAASKGHENAVKVLLDEEGVEPDCKDNYARTPLLWAAENGHVVVVKQLLADDRVNLNLKDSFHRQSSLWRAADKGHEKVVKLLLEKGADPDSKDKQGWTPLWAAIGKGHDAVIEAFFESGVKISMKLWTALGNQDDAVIKWLIENGVDPNSRNTSCETPLLWAARRGYISIVKMLLVTGNVDPSLKDKDGRTSLWWAAKNGHEAVVNLLFDNCNVDILLKDMELRESLLWMAAKIKDTTMIQALLDNGFDLEMRNERGQTLLLCAAMDEDADIVTMLFKKGAELDTKDSSNRTPLSYAAGKGNKEMVELLLEKGADLETEDSSNRTPLLYAAKNGNKEVVGILLEKGAHLETEDSSNQTPLLHATMKKNKEIIEMLLKKGADLETKDLFEQTPLIYAAKKETKAIIELLLEKGANLEAKDRFGRTPLWHAIKKKVHNKSFYLWFWRRPDEVITKLLLEKGAYIETKDNYGQTPLSYAAKNGNKEAIEMLLEEGADIETKDNYGQTPLSYAAERGEIETVELLLERGADLESTDHFERTPLSYAAENGNKEAIEMLLEEGADLETKDCFERTPLSYAVEEGHIRITMLLENPTISYTSWTPRNDDDR